MAKPPPTPKPATPKRTDDPSNAFAQAFVNGVEFKGPIPKLRKTPPPAKKRGGPHSLG